MKLPATKNHPSRTSNSGRPYRWTLEMFHDGDCPLCNREVAFLRKLDRTGKIKFTDIAAPDFDPAAYGKDLGTLTAEIHARRPDGSWIRGVEVFRQLYSAVGFRCLVNISRLPVLSQFLGLGYRVFAKNRLRLTGRCDADGSSCRTSSSTPKTACASS